MPAEYMFWVHPFSCKKSILGNSIKDLDMKPVGDESYDSCVKDCSILSKHLSPLKVDIYHLTVCDSFWSVSTKVKF